LDNITHSLAGWALGEAGLKHKTRKGLAALILAANMPDLDVFTQWAPWTPLATHRGFTHSLVGGVLLMPPILCGLLLLLDRWQVRRGTRFKSGLAMHPRWLLALCYIGALTHPLLDLQTTYSVQLFSPLSGRWYHSDSLFIVDIWLWIGVGGALLWSKLRKSPAAVRWALIAAVGYIGFNLGLSDTASALVRARDPAATSIFASPPPLRFWQRDMTWRHGDRIGRAKWSFLHSLGPSKPLVADNMADPMVRTAIRHDPRLRKFLGWSILPVAAVARHGCTATVTITDARYGLPGDKGLHLARDADVALCRPTS
jgi:inner membrane protein